MKKITVIFILCFSVLFGVKCFIVPPEAVYNYIELIDKTPTIILVKCTEAKLSRKKMFRKYDVQHLTYKLDTVKCLTGYFFSDVIHTGNRGRRIYRETTYSNHSDSQFWNSPLGRSDKGAGECGTDHCFKEGHTYLYFVETNINAKAAERIEVEDDQWLVFVKNRLKETGRLNP